MARFIWVVGVGLIAVTLRCDSVGALDLVCGSLILQLCTLVVLLLKCCDFCWLDWPFWCCREFVLRVGWLRLFGLLLVMIVMVLVDLLNSVVLIYCYW